MSKLKYVPGSGNKHAYVVLVGEAPGRDEEEQGKPFVGESGKLLNEALASIGWDREQLYITNVVKVRPPDNRPPTLEEVETWKSLLFKEINEVAPFLIIALGSTALRAFNDNLKITKDQGKLINLSINNRPCVLSAVFHPSYILRGYNDRNKWFESFKQIQYQSGIKLSSS